MNATSPFVAMTYLWAESDDDDVGVPQLNPCPAEVVRELLAHGAHIDTVNYEGETAEQILKASAQSLASIVNPLRYTSLRCLAARTVKNYRLPYRHVLPLCLYSTVLTH